MTFRKRYIIVLTLNSLFSIIFMSSLPLIVFKYLTPRRYGDTKLIAQQNFHKELYARLTDNEELLKEVPRGPHILMILTRDRGVVYNHNNEEIEDINIDRALLGVRNLYDIRSRFRTESFIYGDDYGIFVFNIDRKSLIGTVRLYTIPISIFAIICFILLPSIINFSMLYNLKRSFYKLETAADRVSKGDFRINLVRKKKDELYSFYESFNRMGTMLQESRDQKSRLLMSISHDLKTPLTSMKGYIEAFKDNLVPKSKKEEYFNIIVNKSGILEERINNLVDFSKIETSEWKSSFEKINVNSFLTELTLAFKEDCIIYNREFDYSINIPKDFIIVGDIKLLSRAIENLLENAKRYTEDGGKISFNASANNNLVIIISDWGRGISKEDIKYIFEPFYKADKGRNSKGMGMGLYTVKSIIENHEGTIECRSNLGEGSEFTITLG